MKLTYRAIRYESNQPPLDLVESELGGKYRGNAWQIHYPRHIPVPLTNPSLKYRGVAYHQEDVRTWETQQPAATGFPQTPPSTSISPSNLTSVHTASICRILEHRLKVAQARGDERLLKLLELEAQQLAC